MSTYHNVMEDLVEEQYESVRDTLGVCTCDRCRSDIITLALNSLAPRYTSTLGGTAISKAAALDVQYRTDIRTAIIRAAKVVGASPRH